MKKVLYGAICILGLQIAACEMEVPTKQVGSFSIKDFCQLTGGVYIDQDENQPENNDRCICGGKVCGEYVTCVVNEKGEQICMGAENVDHPQYTCTIKGMKVCFDRVIETPTESGISYSQAGYYVECDGSNWTSPQICPKGNSCKQYLEHNMLYSTECGECQNNGDKCINGMNIQ